MALAATVSHDVACSGGSGTVTEDSSDDNSGGGLTVVLNACTTELGDFGPVTMNGTLKFNFRDMSGDMSSFVYELLAAQYAVKGDNVEILLDCDMRVEGSDSEAGQNVVTSGKQLTTSYSEMPEIPLAVAAATAPIQRTMTLRDYRQTMARPPINEGDDGYTVRAETAATVETNAFGTTTTYRLTTPQTLVYTASFPTETYGFTAGQLKVVGKGNASLLITANGEADGTFKLQRDGNGDGTIDATVPSVTADELNLYLNGGLG